MPSKTPAQARLMAAAAHDKGFAKKVGVPQSVAKEYNRADTRSTPNRSTVPARGDRQARTREQIATRNLSIENTVRKRAMRLVPFTLPNDERTYINADLVQSVHEVFEHEGWADGCSTVILFGDSRRIAVTEDIRTVLDLLERHD